MTRERKWYFRYKDEAIKVFFLKSAGLIKFIAKKPHKKRISVTKDMNFWKLWSENPFLRANFIEVFAQNSQKDLYFTFNLSTNEHGLWSLNERLEIFTVRFDRLRPSFGGMFLSKNVP